MWGVLWMGLLAAPAGGTPSLDQAEASYRDGRYELVLPLLERALADPALSKAGRLRAHALSALVHSAFDRPTDAIAAYERALGEDPSFDPGEAVSPKVRSLYEEARRNVGRRQPEWAPATPQPPPPAVQSAAPAPPWYRSGWVWVAGGAAILGAGAATAFALQPRLPEGNVPNGTLR